MTLDQLRIFVAVAERNHVTRAAESLHLSQSAVSAAIAALETRYGVRLFNRVGRGIELTETGREFLAEARAVLTRAEQAEATLAGLGGLTRGTLRVRASQTIASYWLPRHLVAFRRAHPGIEIALSVGNTAEVTAAVLAGHAELGFIEGDAIAPNLASRLIARDRIVIVLGAQHPRASSRLTVSDLTTLEWVLREPGSGTRAVFEAALPALGISVGQLQVALELPSNESVRAAVEAGMGATALSASVAASGLEAGTLALVDIKLPDRFFQMVWHTERDLSRAARRLGEIIAGPANASPT